MELQKVCFSKEEAEERIGEIVGRGTPGTFLSVKIIGLSDIRDKYGADLTRQVRSEVLELLRGIKRQSDILGQLEEDVFLLYYTRRQTEDFIKDKCDFLNTRLRIKVDELMGEQRTAPIGMSFGIVRIPDEGRSFQTILDKSLSALDEVLVTGRSGYEIYHDASRSLIGDEDVSPALSVLKTRISEPGAPSGAYKVRANEFTVIYQFAQRFCPDMQICAGMVLFEVRKRSKSEMSEDDIKAVCDDFFNLLYNSLRRRDVVTKYSTDQVLAIFTAEDEFGLHAAIERILDSWKERYADAAKEVHITAEMLVMMGDE